MAGVKKLLIEAFETIKYEGDAVASFEVMFNPVGYSEKYDVEYDSASGKGTSASTQSFCRIKPKEYTLEFLFDATGVTASLQKEKTGDTADKAEPQDKNSVNKTFVQKRIEEFINLTAKIQGTIHRPYFLKITWGSLSSRCILKSANITYTLFNEDGAPLRARVSATFSENLDDEARVRKENRQSPDLIHYRKVKEGESLPLLCYNIYGDSAYYLEIARLNGLTHFRNLETGMLLQFPPIDQWSKE